MSVQPVPAGYHSVTPYLILRNAVEAIEFYKKAFNATEVLRLTSPDGTIGHAEVKIGDSHVMMGEESQEMEIVGPETLNGSSLSLMIYTEDADALFNQAVAAGATVMRPMADQFYGDRSGMLKDPYGHQWSIATHIEDVSQEEVQRRFDEMMKPQE